MLTSNTTSTVPKEVKMLTGEAMGRQDANQEFIHHPIT